MDVPSPVTTWIDADWFAATDVARPSLHSTFRTGLGFHVSHHRDAVVATRVTVPDQDTDTASVTRSCPVAS